MHLTQELQQILLVHSLPSTSTATTTYLEAALRASLTNLLERLRYTIRRIGLPASSANAPSSIPPYDVLLLLLHRHDKPRFYRLSQYLGWDETRKKAKEAGHMPDLEMLNEDDAQDPEDAWLGEVSNTNASAAGLGGDGLLPYDVLSLFEEHAQQTEELDAETNEGWMRRALATPGLVEHFKRLRALDVTTVDMQPSDYVQFAESRAQASFSHHKTRTKRFEDFVVPLLTLFDMTITDELIDALGFLAFEIVSDLIEKAKEQAKERILALREAEGKRSLQRKALTNASLNKGAKRKANNGEKGKGGSKGGKKPAKSSKQLKLEREKELEAKKREENLMPVGPFSAPPMQQASSSVLTCPGMVSAQPEGGAAGALSESIKADGPTPMADVVSGLDVLVADYEEVVSKQTRRTGNGPLGRRRGARFCDRFAR